MSPSDKTRPNLALLEGLISELGISPAWLLTGEGPMIIGAVSLERERIEAQDRMLAADERMRAAENDDEREEAQQDYAAARDMESMLAPTPTNITAPPDDTDLVWTIRDQARRLQALEEIFDALHVHR